MKYRLLVSCIALIIAVACCIVAYSKLQDYLKGKSEVEANISSIDVNNGIISNLRTQFVEIRGEDAPKNLKEILAFVSQYEDLEIIEMKNFSVLDSGISIIGNVTSASDRSICDGYEITISTNSLPGFIQFLDGGNLTFHSTDFQLGANTAILRILVGGAL